MNSSDIVTCHGGSRIDISRQKDKLRHIGMRGQVGDLDEKEFISDFGERMSNAAGPDALSDLVDDMERASDITPEFAAILRKAWEAFTLPF